MSVLDAELLCMKALRNVKRNDSSTAPWKYIVNLTGQEFPLKNNLELTRILKTLNGANLVDQEK